MFQATFSFSTQHGHCGLQVDAIGSNAAQVPSVEMTFRIKDTASASFRDVRVGRLLGYAAWSEAPLALLLRCLHWLRVDGFSSIPSSLYSHPVRDVHLSVQHLTRNGLTSETLASLTLAKIGCEDGYRLTQSLPNGCLFNMEIDAWSAVPLGAALKAVAQVQLENVELHNVPEAVQVPAFTDDNGRLHVLREQIPYFARPVFDALQANSSDIAEPLVPAVAWTNFLAA